MYQALYRTWRPTVFSDVVGQGHITQTLKRQVEQGRVSHAYLFTGTRGTGKTTCAKILAKAVNCLHPVGGDPCNCCEACVGIDSGSCVDVQELDAASNNGVDQVRALRDEAVYAPANVKWRVYIVDEVHMLSTSAFNALLKILEEPPEHLLFILATTELHKVPATILSRCQRYSFQRISPKDIRERLEYVAGQENLDLRSDGAELLSRLADGALRDGLSLLDQCAAVGGTIDAERVLDTLGLAGNIQTAQLMEYILRRDAPQALDCFHRFYTGGKDVSAVLGELSALVRDLLLRKTAPEGSAALLSGGYDLSLLDKLGKNVSGKRLLFLASTIQRSAGDLYYSTNRRLDGELCILRLCDETLSGDLDGLAARIERLETSGVTLSPPPTTGKDKPKPGKKKLPEPPPECDAPPWDLEPPPLKDEPPPGYEEPPVARQDLPIPAAASVTKTAPATVPATKTEALAKTKATPGVFDWKSLAEGCKGKLPGMYRSFLDRCSGQMQDGVLQICAPDELTRGRLDNQRFYDALKDGGAEYGVTSVRLTVGEGQNPPQVDKLQDLIRRGSRLENFKLQ
jgi:DNA polymerase-3 subunit gamma/tau